jgi:hypothetical protein
MEGSRAVKDMLPQSPTSKQRPRIYKPCQAFPQPFLPCFFTTWFLCQAWCCCQSLKSVLKHQQKSLDKWSGSRLVSSGMHFVLLSRKVVQLLENFSIEQPCWGGWKEFLVAVVDTWSCSLADVLDPPNGSNRNRGRGFRGRVTAR